MITQPFTHEDPLNSLAGSYSPRYMTIKLLESCDKVNSTEERLDNIEFPPFIHELSHHIQNVSTILGLAHFDALICLWQNVRNYIYDSLDTRDSTEIKKSLSTLKYWQPNNKKITRLLNIKNIIAHDINVTDKIAYPAVEIECNDGIVYFGLHEFLECMAYTMERFFCTKTGIEIAGIKPIPYKIADAVIQHYDIEIPDEYLLIIFLSSLQYTNPHYQFYLIIDEVSKLPKESFNIHLQDFLHNRAREYIEINSGYIAKTKKQCVEGFPLQDKSHGDIIKDIVEIIDLNIKKRKDRIFFEVEIFNKINSENMLSQVDKLILHFGECIIIRQKPFANPDDVGVSKLASYKENGMLSHNIREWEVLQAAIHYTIMHISGHDSIDIKSPEENELITSPCPHYSYCLHDNRRSSGDICRNTPWKHPPAHEKINICPYQKAVYKTKLENYKKTNFS